jgi:hypothetical protein
VQSGDGGGPNPRGCGSACRDVERAISALILNLGVDPDSLPRLSIEPARTGKGVIVRESGTSGPANTIRIMEPTPRYPRGYIRYTDNGGGYIDPATGDVPPGGGRTAPETHIDVSTYNGPFKNLPFSKGWGNWKFPPPP